MEGETEKIAIKIDKNKRASRKINGRLSCLETNYVTDKPIKIQKALFIF